MEKLNIYLTSKDVFVRSSDEIKKIIQTISGDKNFIKIDTSDSTIYVNKNQITHIKVSGQSDDKE